MKRRGACGIIVLLILIIIILIMGRGCVGKRQRLIGNEPATGLIYVSAPWCHFCPAQTKIIKELENEGVPVFYVDYDKNGKTYKVNSVPTTIVVRIENNDAYEIKRFIGHADKATIKKVL